MRVRVLGSAAGGGLPQWNCGCPNCRDARAGASAVRPRTQSSIAVGAVGGRWLLVNASPDLRSQIEAFPALHPDGVRGSAIAAAMLTDAEVDHTAGLLLLREGGTLSLHGTDFVRRALEGNGLLPTLGAYLALRWTEIVPGRPFRPAAGDGTELGLEVEAFDVPGDPPLYWREDGRIPAGDASRGAPTEGGHTIGLRLREPGADASLVYVPGSGEAGDDLIGRIGPQDVLLWDGTFWTDDELARLGISQRRAREMGHLPLSGPGGSLEAFRNVAAGRKILVHVNNTNPILRRGSPERLAVEAAGWEVAHDGMELEI